MKYNISDMQKIGQKAWDYMKLRLKGIRGKYGEEYVWLGSLEVRLNALWAWVVAIWTFLTGWIVVVYEWFVAWITPIVNWLWAKVMWLVDLIYTWVKPAIDFLYAVVSKLETWINKVEQTLLFRIIDIYNKFFGWYETLRQAILAISDKFERLIALVSRDLAVKLDKATDDLVRQMDKYTRDIRDWAMILVRDTLQPVKSALAELRFGLEELTKRTLGTIEDILKIITPTIEKPGLLRKETMQATGEKYGLDFLDSTLELSKPYEAPFEVSPTGVTEAHVRIATAITNVNLGLAGNWADLEKKQDETLFEITKGIEAPTDTKIELSEEWS